MGEVMTTTLQQKPKLKRQDISNTFSPVDYQRGRYYFEKGRVREVFIENDQYLTGRVQGSRRTLYQVQITLDTTTAPVTIKDACTCPLGHRCKHVVAVLLTHVAGMTKTTIEHEVPESKPNSLSPQVEKWLKQVTADQQAPKSSLQQQQYRVIYILAPDFRTTYREQPSVFPALMIYTYQVRPLKKGGWSQPKPYYPGTDHQRSIATHEDLEIFASLNIVHENSMYASPRNGWYRFYGKQVDHFIEKLIYTQRVYWQSMDHGPITLGDTRAGQLTWFQNEYGEQFPNCELLDEALQRRTLMFHTQPLIYVDPEALQMGFIETPMQDRTLQWLEAPPITPSEANMAAETLGQQFKNQNAIQLPATYQYRKTRTLKPKPHLYLAYGHKSEILEPPASELLHNVSSPIMSAELSFDYDGIICPYDDAEQQLQQIHQDTLTTLTRHQSREQRARRDLEKWGFKSVSTFLPFIYQHAVNPFILSQKHRRKMEDFIDVGIAKLEDQGWKVTYDDHFPFRPPVEIEAWYSELNETQEWQWFSLELGVIINGERVNLLPYLVNIIQNPAENQRIKQLAPEDPVTLKVDERSVKLEAGRTQVMLDTIEAIYKPRDGQNQQLKVSRYHAALLAEMEKAFRAQQLRWYGSDKLHDLSQKLHAFTGIKTKTTPDWFQTTLRPYQQTGVDWLQFLREYELGGVLADDMGLGKTIQALAHIAIEKSQQRLTSPCLIIAPTSVLVNWQMEAAKFTPQLSTMIWRGTVRHQYKDQLDQYDLVITSYPLLVRDREILTQHHYTIVILDEAQHIKNSQAKVTQIAHQLKASQRLCLTGTPLENHLGELWSLFNFLMPGLLGSKQYFRSFFGNPIEKEQHTERQKQLHRLVRPFIMRRQKKEVTQELPEKNEIIRYITLDKSQRDLYETLRLAMHRRVKEAVEKQGIERSQITILDALLKLRQACCDPRLVSLESAKKVKESAKLDELIHMVTDLVEEGRRILIFSQFRKMIELVEQAFDKKIDYVKLTGQTEDRKTPISRFQKGEVSVFLISLKAGGTGLNLTKADTVIHYDQWWNPAVENQATDRAHRIGQTKNVMVYKLICQETVEEKILDMQNKKRTLIESLLNHQQTGSQITRHELNELFEAHNGT